MRGPAPINWQTATDAEKAAWCHQINDLDDNLELTDRQCQLIAEVLAGGPILRQDRTA